MNTTVATSLRWDLVPALLAHLPAHDADLIGLMDPLDHLSHVELYAALRRHDIEPPADLLEPFLRGLFGHLEAVTSAGI